MSDVVSYLELTSLFELFGDITTVKKEFKMNPAVLQLNQSDDTLDMLKEFLPEVPLV